MTKRAKVSVRSTSGKRCAFPLVEAELIVDDTGRGVMGDSFNHPQLWVTMESPSGEKVSAVIQFQRHGLRGDESRDWASSADPFIDTASPWSACYGGAIELQFGGKVALSDFPFELDLHDKARAALARLIARTIREYNLDHVSKDDAVQAYKALEKLGVACQRTYRLSTGRVGFWQLCDHGINTGAAHRLRRGGSQ